MKSSFHAKEPGFSSTNSTMRYEACGLAALARRMPALDKDGAGEALMPHYVAKIHICTSTKHHVFTVCNLNALYLGAGDAFSP